MWNKNDNLRNLKRVMNHLGYQMVDGTNEKWNLMWSIEYPYDKFPHIIKNMTFSKDQKLNHFPGINYLTNKRSLSTSTISKYILPGFRIPEDKIKFENFAESNPMKKYVVKNYGNGGVKLVTIDEIKYMNLGESKFIQVFMDNPFLVEGHAFDIGVYVLITSLDPLVIYRFKSECLFRFCSEPYQPFNSNNTRKYVVGYDKLHIWNMRSFEKISNDYSHLKLFENYFKSKGQNVNKLWNTIDEAIVMTILQMYKSMHYQFEKECNFYNCTNDNFFELLRFDFMIDVKANVYLMEVNMSPNLTPAKPEYERNSAQYEQVIYNTLRIIGFEGYQLFKEDYLHSPMTSRNQNLAVNMETCKICQNSCSLLSCNVCTNCMSYDFIEVLHKINREHQNRGEFKRIFPTNSFESNHGLIDLISEKTKLLNHWFNEKCNEDNEWC
ncbi:hypothetical protein PVAND_008016 [Polypedilum vanderplanki]|uniref:Uncharacterized protein n=1 Tax=Polypedilum vanderplanki TaxID=319348 RepID=A0A9J6C975_POLVA|nr:hypothetical protein PVAND_008016 [Polypedilum vanderplanki]